MRLTRLLLLILPWTLVVGAAPGSAGAQARWRLEEVARIGGVDDGLAAFNEIIDLQLAADGKVWVLDRQAQSLRLFAADGAPLREVARRGRGPGELTNANGLSRGAEGRIWVRDHSNQRLVAFAPDGGLSEQRMAASHGYGYRWDGVVDREGRMIETIRVPRGEGRVTMLHRRSADGSRTDTVAMPSSCSDLAPPSSEIRGRSGATAVPFAARIINVLTADGAVWCALTDEYKPRRFAFGAPRHDRELFLAAPRVPIPSAERDAAIAETEAFLARVGGAVEPWSRAMVPRDRGPLHWFEEDDVGRLWVLRQRPDQGFEFDVWDRAGLRIATLTAPIGGDYLPLFRVVNGKLATLVLDEDELPVVAVYLIRER